MRRRLVIAGLGAVGALATSATPAQAISINQFVDARAVVVTVSDCSRTAALGTECRGFTVTAEIAKTEAGVVAKNISVDGLDVTVNGPNGAATGPKVSDGSAVAGSLVTVATSARSATLKFSVVLACDSEPCAVSGLFAIKLTVGKSATSVYSTSGGTSHVELPPSCRIDSGGSGATLTEPAAKGSVKQGAVTKALRPVASDSGSISRSYSFNKQKGTCV